MSFNSKQALSGGTSIATEVIGSEHYQKVIPVGVDGSNEPDSTKFFSVSFVVAPPTTLTTGLNYFILRNPHATKKIKIKRIVADAIFTGTAAATRSAYAMKKLKNVTATTGTAIPIAMHNSTGTSSIAEVKWLSTGLTATGAVDDFNISHIAHANQLTANITKDLQFDNPLVLNTNESIVLQNEGAVVLGSAIVFTVQFYEI